MPSRSRPLAKGTFAWAVEALCLSRVDIARALGISPALLDAYVDGTEPVPATTQLQLVDVVKSHEAMLGAAAGSLYEESMYRLERNSPSVASPTGDRPPAPPSGPEPRPTDPS